MRNNLNKLISRASVEPLFLTAWQKGIVVGPGWSWKIISPCGVMKRIRFLVGGRVFLAPRRFPRTPYHRSTLARKNGSGSLFFKALAAQRTAFHRLAETARHRDSHP